MSYEKEVKILNVDVDEIKKRLECIGARFISEGLQSIKTYDFMPYSFRVYSLLNKYLETKENLQYRTSLVYLLKELDQLMSNSDKCTLQYLSGYDSLSELFQNSEFERFFLKDVQKLLDSLSGKVDKWIRLRKNHFSTELTIKQIYPRKENQLLEEVDELQIEVSDFEKTDKILNSLGFIATNYQEKYRSSYQFGDLCIEIDRWPLLNAYIEIEGPSEESIISCANKLGFSETDLISANTVDVYKLSGLDLFQYTNLTFELEKRE